MSDFSYKFSPYLFSLSTYGSEDYMYGRLVGRIYFNKSGNANF